MSYPLPCSQCFFVGMSTSLIKNADNSVDISTFKGDTLGPITVTFTQTGYDWTGTTVKMQARKKKNQDPAVIDITPTPSYPSLGDVEVTIEVAAASMDTIAAGTYFYDMELTRPDSRVRTYLWGKIEIVQDVTRS